MTAHQLAKKARVCEHCKKAHGVIPHAVQDTDGRMRTAYVHLGCLKRFRARFNVGHKRLGD